MPAFNRFNSWTDTMVETANCGTDQFAIALTNVAPSASNTVLADITQISYTGFGSRNLVTTSSSQTAGNYSLVFASLTLGTTVTSPTFRYVVIYDDTLAGDPLVGWYDIGATTIPANTSLIFSGMGLDLKGSFSPLSLFTGGFQGGWYDPSDITTLWQNSGRTVPVTASGDPVGAIDDKSGNGNHLLQATTSQKPIYRDVSGFKYLDFDNIDDWVSSTATINFSATDKISFFAGVMRNASGAGTYAQAGNITSDAGSFEFGSFNTGVVLYRKGSGSFGAREVAMTSNVTHVLTALLDLAGTTQATENPSLKVDTAQTGFTNYGTADSGTGNFGNRTMYVGRKNGSGTEVNTGRIYQLILVGKTASTTEISDTETFINGKTSSY